MSTVKKAAPNEADKLSAGGHPPEAFDYHNDVTAQAVDKVRRKAALQLNAADLELVDGTGKYSV